MEVINIAKTNRIDIGKQGWLEYVIYEEISGERILYICGLFVLEENRRKKVGTSLMKMLFEIGKVNRCQCVCLNTRYSNLEARMFYRSFAFGEVLGFQKYLG